MAKSNGKEAQRIPMIPRPPVTPAPPCDGAPDLPPVPPADTETPDIPPAAPETPSDPVIPPTDSEGDSGENGGDNGNTSGYKYTAAELAANHKVFGTSREIVVIALKIAGKDSATLDEARAIIEKFLSKELN